MTNNSLFILFIILITISCSGTNAVIVSHKPSPNPLLVDSTNLSDKKKDQWVVVNNLPILQKGIKDLQKRIITPSNVEEETILVTIDYLITEEGVATDFVIISSPSSEYAQAVIEALTQVRYIPGKVQNKPAKFLMRLEVEF